MPQIFKQASAPKVIFDEGLNWADVIAFQKPEYYVNEVLNNRRRLAEMIDEGLSDYVRLAVKKCWESRPSCSAIANENRLDVSKLKSAYKVARKAIVTSYGFGGVTPVSLNEQPDGTWRVMRDYETIAAIETVLLLRNLSLDE
jgi:hypothetical protein